MSSSGVGIKSSNGCFDCCSIAVAWAIDDVAPLVKKNLCALFRESVLFASHVSHECLSYGIAGLYEEKKAVVSLTAGIREAAAFPQDVVLATLSESADYLRGGVYALCQATVCIWDGGKAVCQAISHLFIEHVFQELGDYLISGGKETLSCIKALPQTLSEIARSIIHCVHPFFQESTSYLASGFHATSQGIKVGLDAILEADLILYRIIAKIGKEVLSYGFSAAHQLPKTFAMMYQTSLEMGQIISPLATESGSYIASGFRQIANGLFFGLDVLDEGSFAPRKVTFIGASELGSYVLSGFYETTRSIRVLGLGILEAMYVPTTLLTMGGKELASYMKMGFLGVSQGMKSLDGEVAEALAVIEEPILYAIDEELSYLYSGQKQIKHARKFVLVDISNAWEHEVRLPIARSLGKWIAPFLARGRMLRNSLPK